MDQHNTFFTTMPPTSYGQTAPSGYIGLPMGSLAPPQSPLSAHHSPHDPMGVSGPYDNSHIQPMAHIPGPHEGQNMYDVSGLSPMMSGPYVPGAMASSLPNPHGGMNMEQPMMHNPMDSQSYHSMQQPMVPVPQEDGYSMMDPMNVGPVDFSSAATNNILTEFTKKRNWPQRLLEEVPDFIHVLSSDGKILYAANSSKALTGYAPEELIGKLIVDFIHEDDAALFWLEFNECMKNQTQFRMYFRLRTKNNGWTVFDVEGHPHFTHGPRNDHLQRLPDADKRGDCAGFFMNARPYPSKNMEMLDSYAEHRIENVRLNRRVHDLKLEEEEDAYGHLSSPSYGDSTPRGYGSVGNSTPHSALSMQHGMVSPLGTAPGPLTKQNLDVSGSSRVDSLDDKMARYGVAHGPDPIEMFTGLRYRDGERSKGLSTGDTSPALLRGDAGVPLPSEPHPRHSGEKKKKQKIAEEYVCTDCATLESPEWRKGPKGPKTLCNACGLRWAKREKKKQQEAQQQQQAANANK